MARLKAGLSDAASDALRAAGVTVDKISQTMGSATASAGTHEKDGVNADGTPYSAAVDLRSKSMSEPEIKSLLGKLADVGFVSWYRKPGADGWPSTEVPHIHAVYCGVAMKPALQNQVHDWLDGKNGLASHANYKFWKPTELREQQIRWLFLNHNPAVAGGAVVKPNYPKPGPKPDPGTAYSLAFRRALEHVLIMEGGYSNHPADNGGPTNLGITQAVLSAYLGRQATVDEVKALTPDKVAPIYRERYWEKMGLDGIADPRIAALLFDQGVNRGAITVVKEAQALAKVAQDGDLGPVSAAAINEMPVAYFLREFIQAAQHKYLGIAFANASQLVFLKGWITRTHAIWDYVSI